MVYIKKKNFKTKSSVKKVYLKKVKSFKGSSKLPEVKSQVNKVDRLVEGKKVNSKWNFSSSSKHKTIFIVAVVFLIFVLYFFAPFKKICTDQSCFNSKYFDCKPVKYHNVKTGNYYTYTIKRSLGSDCTMKIKYVSSAPGTSQDVKDLLEGNSMVCKIPKSLVKTTSIQDNKNLLGYCTGPLKEGMYELIIKKMYSMVIANLNDVLDKVYRAL